jgi:assimilatory nitrate reductase catalytic subunit
MFVCSCFAITDKTIQAAIEDGADSVAAVTRACKAGGDCGACQGMIADMIEASEETPRRCLPQVRAAHRAA